jgi:integrase
MPTIRERLARDGKKKFHVQVRMSGFPAMTASFTTRRAAERWAKTIEASMIEGRHFKGSEARRRSLGEAIDRYVLEEAPKKRGHAHGNHLAWWRAKIGALKLADVTPAVLAEHRGKLARETYTRAKVQSKRSTVKGREAARFTRKPATVNRYLAACSHVFTIACREWHWSTHNPFAAVGRLSEGPGRVRCLSLQERQRLLAETGKDPALHSFVLIALSTAARAGEIAGLAWRDVDLKDGRLLLRVTKNAEPRAAWLIGDALRLLKEHGKVRRLGGGAVFTSKTGKRYRYEKPFAAACKAAQLIDVRFHDLRHTAATLLAREGASEQQLRAIGGWKSGVVSRYVHLAAADARDVLEKMNKKILGGADAKETEKQ